MRRLFPKATSNPDRERSIRLWQAVVILSALSTVCWLALGLMCAPALFRVDWAPVIGLYIIAVAIPSVVLLVGLHQRRVWADWLSLVFDTLVASLISGIAYHVALWGGGDSMIAAWLVLPGIASILRGSITLSKRIGWPAIIAYLGLAGFLAYRGFLLAEKLPS